MRAPGPGGKELCQFGKIVRVNEEPARPAAPGRAPGLDAALGAVGPRLHALRRRRETTLASLSAATGISVSTLSRLESGDRKPTLELLLPLARAYGVTLDELVGAPPTGDPRVHPRPVTRDGMTMLPLTPRLRSAAGPSLRCRARRRRCPPGSPPRPGSSTPKNGKPAKRPAVPGTPSRACQGQPPYRAQAAAVRSSTEMPLVVHTRRGIRAWASMRDAKGFRWQSDRPAHSPLTPRMHAGRRPAGHVPVVRPLAPRD
jgi:transcriptional regulator with XRE-family HTH domain